MSTTTLTLYNAVGILDDLITTTNDVLRCDNCGDELGSDTWNICSGPVAPEGTPGIPAHHEGHTACTKCALDPLSYIAEGGACKPCLTALGGRRSNVIKAGVAMRPPVKNVIANKMIHCHETARKHIDKAQDAQDAERRKEGADRRATAVEDVRRRREEAEKEAIMIREKALEDARIAKETAETERREEDDRRRREFEKRNLEEQHKLAEAKKKMEDETRVAMEEERRVARRAVDVELAAAKKTMEDERRTQAEADAIAARFARDEPPAATTTTTSGRKKRGPQSQDVIDRRMAASKETRDAKKQKIIEYEFILAQNKIYSMQLTKVREIASHWLTKVVSSANAGGALDADLVESMENEIQDELDALQSLDIDDLV